MWAADAGQPPIVLVDGVGAEALDVGDSPPLGAGAPRRGVHRSMRRETAIYLCTSGLLGADPPDPARVSALLEVGRDLGGAGAWASEFARRAAERFGEPTGEAVVASIRLEAPAAPAMPTLPLPQEPQWVTLQVHIDPADLRTRGLLRILGLLTNLVRDVELHVELVDVNERTGLTESAGALATPTIIRGGPGQPMRVSGWFDSARALGKALQLSMEPAVIDEPA